MCGRIFHAQQSCTDRGGVRLNDAWCTRQAMGDLVESRWSSVQEEWTNVGRLRANRKQKWWERFLNVKIFQSPATVDSIPRSTNPDPQITEPNQVDTNSWKESIQTRKDSGHNSRERISATNVEELLVIPEETIMADCMEVSNYDQSVTPKIMGAESLEIVREVAGTNSHSDWNREMIFLHHITLHQSYTKTHRVWDPCMWIPYM